MVVSTRSRATGDAAVSVPQQHTRPLRYASGSTQPGFWFERPFLYAGVVDEEVAAAAGETVSWSSSIPLEYDGEFTVRIVARRLRWTDHLGVQVMPDDGGSPAADGQAEEGVGGLAPADHPRLECLLRVRITSNELGQKVVVFADEQVVRPRFAIVNRTSCSVLYKWSFWRMQARYEQVPPHKTRVVCPGRPGPYHLIACLEREAEASGRRRRRTRPRTVGDGGCRIPTNLIGAAGAAGGVFCERRDHTAGVSAGAAFGGRGAGGCCGAAFRSDISAAAPFRRGAVVVAHPSVSRGGLAGDARPAAAATVFRAHLRLRLRRGAQLSGGRRRVVTAADRRQDAVR
eukprot:ctg_2966.g592